MHTKYFLLQSRVGTRTGRRANSLPSPGRSGAHLELLTSGLSFAAGRNNRILKHYK